jgi:hypothetical protein
MSRSLRINKQLSAPDPEFCRGCGIASRTVLSGQGLALNILNYSANCGPDVRK